MIFIFKKIERDYKKFEVAMFRTIVWIYGLNLVEYFLINNIIIIALLKAHGK